MLDTTPYQGADLDGDGSICGLQLTPECTLQVEIDIKPGSDRNCLNINGHGVIPVAILGSDELDVAAIEPDSLAFGGLVVRVKGNGAPQCAFEDSDLDGWMDLVCHFVDDPTNWSLGDATATLEGQLFDGTRIMGSDEICIVP
jgi:hypothetical protein